MFLHRRFNRIDCDGAYDEDGHDQNDEAGMTNDTWLRRVERLDRWGVESSIRCNDVTM